MVRYRYVPVWGAKIRNLGLGSSSKLMTAGILDPSLYSSAHKHTTRSGTAISGTRVFGSSDFPTRRFARTLKNTRQSKQIKTHPSTIDLQAITTNRLGNFCRLALQEASILMDTPKGHIFSPPRPPKRAEATAFSPSRHEKFAGTSAVSREQGQR